MISEFRSEDGKACVLHLHDIPGGAKAFELAAKFCYDIRIELNATNVVPVRCAAEHLLMTEDYVGGNLITRTDNFLGEVLGSWKDTIKALEACESVLPHAEDLHIVSRCINSLASKACSDPSLSAWPVDWWYIDASFLGLPLFKRLILAMEAKGMKPENVAEALIYSAKRSLPGLSGGSTAARMTPGISISAASESEQRVFLEEIVDLLPMNKGVISTRFLLRLLQSHPWLTESEREQICQLINCQKLSLEACTHAAQNERLPLRLVVQVLFFEQLHLRSSIAGWLFVSDRVENSQAPHANLALQKSSNVAIQADISEEQENDDHHVDVDDMRSQVLELEKECLSMKQEIGKLGKPRSSWNIFSRKCGFGVKSQSVAGGK
ncbi:BTB POZ domain-containing protein [Musa troglodytarum]|uniref:BTB POZ domain-containing protein n=1 Tax=Musa troglodytarum TaxID=320322 RepID=A0A9E7FC81_9LILI|nr:BTB POZ domain-containing protein [Musa troglodytarum]